MKKLIKKLLGISIITGICLFTTISPAFASVNYYDVTYHFGGSYISNTAHTTTNDLSMLYLDSSNHFSNGQSSYYSMGSSQLNSFFSTHPGGTADCSSYLNSNSSVSSAYSEHEWCYSGDYDSYRKLTINVY